MSIWGKLIGGVAGFMTGGPLGAVMGAALGHAADAGAPLLGRDPAGLAALLGSREQLFAIGVVVLSAKLAKCDGPVTRAEIDAFKRRFRVPPESQREVALLFDRARDDPTGYEPFADRMGEAFADNRAMLEEVLAALFEIARADRPLTRGEAAFLDDVRTRFGLDAPAYERASSGQTAGARAAAVERGPDPYAVLGVARDAPDAAVRDAWRKLMRENHPDGLAARGVPDAFIAAATARVAEINAAWDTVKRERKL